MIYAQFRKGQKLHLAYQPGEGYGDEIIRAGHLSWPLCGRRDDRGYRITCNVPLANGCLNCRRIALARQRAANA